jgi:uncharacterized BrkB/YihY/UPF0761 family membrane protein
LHHYDVLLFNARFVAGLFALALALGFVSLYRLAPPARPAGEAA